MKIQNILHKFVISEYAIISQEISGGEIFIMKLKKWYIPLLIAGLLICTPIFRWEKGVMQNNKFDSGFSSFEYSTDRWTGQKWITVTIITYSGANDGATSVKLPIEAFDYALKGDSANRDKAKSQGKLKMNIATGVWFALLLGSIGASVLLFRKEDEEVSNDEEV